MRKFHVEGKLVIPQKRSIVPVRITVENGIISSIEQAEETPNMPFILPGFIDSHVHIESSMLVPSRFSAMAVKHGTVGVVADPHEVANVSGVSGIDFMINDSKNVPLKFFFGVPSCVPAAPFEFSGATINAESVEQLIGREDFYFLAEMMNFPGVINGDSDVLKKLELAIKYNKPIDGHAPGLSGEGLEQYVKSGITTDHECSTVEEALEKINLGMKILIREGSAAKNFESLVPLLKEHWDKVMFCTDDCHPDYLVKGHINKLASRAIKKGYDVFHVLMAACINPVLHYNLPVGLLEAGHWADFVIVDNLQEFNVLSNYIGGEKVFANGEVLFSVPQISPNEYQFRDSFDASELKVTVSGDKMNLIETVAGDLLTNKLIIDVSERQGQIFDSIVQEDILKIVLLNRYDNSPPSIAFIKGFNLKKGAIAASVAHDSHHIIAVGCDDVSLANALTWILNNRGGLCFFNEKEGTGIPLPYYGLMSDVEGEKLAMEYEQLNSLHKYGCSFQNPFMTLSFMALTVIPALKINHNGLFDSTTFESIPLFFS